MLTELLETVIVGALVSFCSTGGLGPGPGPGVGVGTSGSSPQQATMKDSARIEKSILTGKEKCFFMVYLIVMVMGTSNLSPFHWSSMVIICPSMV